MTDFEHALREKLARNEEMAAQRRLAERAQEERRQQELQEREAEREKLHAARQDRHSALVERLTTAAQGLKNAAPESYVVRLGSTERREEFIAKISTRLTEPARSLLVECDLEDDVVLARWNSDLGSALELWRLLEVVPEMMETLVLQVADDQAWQGARPPPFPRPPA